MHYPIPVHLQPALRDLGYRAGDFPSSSAPRREVLSLPMFPELTEQQVETWPVLPRRRDAQAGG